MSRAARLLDLMQLLRRHRRPVTGAALATELGVSLRTLYRDISTLQAQGAPLEGEAGVGYVLRPGFMLPPLMFSEEQIEALVLGSRWVAEHGDTRLAIAAHDALAKIMAVLPVDRSREADSSPLLVGPRRSPEKDRTNLAAIRAAIRSERKLDITYADHTRAETVRTIWPFALGFFEAVRVVVAWCELREDFRHFRTDRIIALRPNELRYPRRRQAMLRSWREQQGIPAP